MPQKKIKTILQERDGLTEQEAEDRVRQARREMHDRLTRGEMPMDICSEEFGLEPDYLEQLMF